MKQLIFFISIIFLLGATNPGNFDRFDLDHNGTIERDESANKRIFDRLDTNKDSIVTREEFRALVTRLTTPAQARLPAPPSVEIKTTLDVPYLSADSNGLTNLDIYQPSSQENHPVLIYVHGGGWQRGDKKAVGYKADHFVANGFVFVSVNYRFRPDVEIEMLQEDIAAATAWVFKNIGNFAGDPQNTFLMGHSAGAHLVSMVGTRADLLRTNDLDLADIRGVIELDTGALDVPLLMTYSKFHIPVFGHDPDVLRAISPIHHIEPDQHTPPFLLVVADDNKRKLLQANNMAEALIKAGAKATVIEAPDRTHGTLNQNLGGTGDPYTAHIMQFIDKHLKKNSDSSDSLSSNNAIP